MLHEEIASVALLQARSSYNQRDADDGVVVSGGLSAQIVVHEHLAVVRHKDEVAVLHSANLFQSRQDAADLFVDVDKIGEVELAVVAPVGDPVRSIPVFRTVTDRVGDEILVHHLQKSCRRMKWGVGLHIADMRVEGLIGGRIVDEIQGMFRDPVGLGDLFRKGQGVVAFGAGFVSSVIAFSP